MQRASLIFLIAAALLLALGLVDIWFDIVTMAVLLKVIASFILAVLLWWVLQAIKRNLNTNKRRD